MIFVKDDETRGLGTPSFLDVHVLVLGGARVSGERRISTETAGVQQETCEGGFAAGFGAEEKDGSTDWLAVQRARDYFDEIIVQAVDNEERF